MKVLVTGASGQLGQELRELSTIRSEFQFKFYDRSEWDISDYDLSHQILNTSNADYLVNAAAYTKVDLAENEPDLCFKMNTDAPANLAKICKTTGTQFIHISTDYVFNQERNLPFRENDLKNPIGNYAVSKSRGEDLVMGENRSSIILRTSWLYSCYGHNFVKTMIRLGREGKNLRVVSDQTGSPTNAKDLANCIIMIMLHNSQNKTEAIKGYYHYCNEGCCSWFEFATEIFKYLNMKVSLSSTTTIEYAAKAHRPLYSCLDCSKIIDVLQIKIPSWKTSLHECLDRIIKQEMNTPL